MTNILKKFGTGIADFGKWIADAITGTVHLAEKIEAVLRAAKPLEEPFVEGLSTVVADVEALIAASGTALSAEGLNFTADSAAYQHFLALIADFKKLAPIVTEALEILEGKSVTTTTSSTAAGTTSAS
ncbi:hypothetical protein [Silvibacterium dinghuense]|uniref:Uncharacterized protein n=1 Tax=Silvibacterium dinghuense TaxID=1560006 RepID=A0A4Q1SIW6_9BACT|nr:hypothetical protein [Silvibacterium dinghuense]RXS97190.1 hypothetical protein ESZ00_04550 [Silvibacterium dinghuense]GGG96952.1 hypothetical protein GCM10011586_10240 [Silvibacterium dinghuense]